MPAPNPAKESPPPAAILNQPKKAPDIYMLAEKIPAHAPDAILGVPDGSKQTVNVHHKLGFWTDQHEAELAAARHNLHVQPIEDGLARTKT